MEKYAELEGFRLLDYSSSMHEQYVEFLEHVIKNLKNRYEPPGHDAEPSYSGECDDEQDEVDKELRDLYFQFEDSEVKLNE